MNLVLGPREVEKAGSQKWNENIQFRRWLKTQNSELLEKSVDQIGRKVASQIDCTQCGNCCKGLSIAPKSQDIRQLSAGLNLSPLEFKQKYLKKDHEGDLVFKQRPCPFLKNNLCSVYEHRPETCRSYPHLESQHMLGRGWHIVENTMICPIVYYTYELLKQHWSYSATVDIQK